MPGAPIYRRFTGDRATTGEDTLGLIDPVVSVRHHIFCRRFKSGRGHHASHTSHRSLTSQVGKNLSRHGHGIGDADGVSRGFVVRPFHTDCMSGFVEFVTTPEFLTGSFVSGLLGAGIGYVSTRSSDKRKFKQEEKMQTRKEDREDKLRDQQNLHTAAMEFVEVSSDILVSTIDIKGMWNIMRDWFYNQTGQDDPMAAGKFDHSEKVMNAQMRIAVPVNKLKLLAPKEVLDAATRATTAIMTTVRQTTEPFASRVAHKAASDELNKFISVFREAAGRDPYTDAETQAQAYAFMETLKQQVADFIEEAKTDMKAAGFKTTPWDAPSGNPPEPDDEDDNEGPTFVGPTPLVTVRSLNVGDDISIPMGRSGRTGMIGLLATIREFNEDRTRMTVLVHQNQKTVTLNVNADQQFIKVPRAAS